MRLILLGKPGSGKGTHARTIAGKFGVPSVATGDLVRAIMIEKSALGAAFRACSESGRLVPDEMVLSLVKQRLQEADCARGYLFDGFPRTLEQAKTLDQWLVEGKSKLNRVVWLEVGDTELVERAIGRRSCPKDGAVFHVKYRPPQKAGMCDQCGGVLIQREDDTREVVAMRLKEYERKTSQVRSFYSDRGLLSVVDGLGAVEEIGERILDAVTGDTEERAVS